MKGKIDPDINIENKTFKTKIIHATPITNYFNSDLQPRKLSLIAKDLGVALDELKTFLSRIVITKNESGLNIAVYNKLRKKK